MTPTPTLMTPDATEINGRVEETNCLSESLSTIDKQAVNHYVLLVNLA
jgi:hypothetical protein